jgi:hypothetical protein
MTFKKDTLTPRLKAIQKPAMGRSVLGRIAILAVKEAHSRVPVKTGNLRRSIRVGQITDHSARILAGGQREVGYAAAVEFGTKPHVIVPRKARVLAWGGNRRLSGTLRSGAKAEFFAMRVNHPGSRAKPYLVPGAKAAMQTAGLKDALVKAWNDAA